MLINLDKQYLSQIENPRVGGSIPPQATKIQAKSPVHVTGLFGLVVQFGHRVGTF